MFLLCSVWKAFTVWKANVRSSKNEKCKAIISKQLFFVDELFRGCLLYIQSLCEDAFSTKGGNELIGTAIHLVKTDRCHTCSLEEFCSLQAEQCNYAHKQLQAFRSKVIEMIKLTCLKVAEMDGAQDCFLSVLFDSKDKSKYAVMPYWRNLVSRFVRFLKLVDNIFQEMLCCLLSSEVQRLLEFFSVSAAFSEEVKKELRSYF
ncbi:dynein axonemal heavy chain 6-like [Protopterus annectens]|uniref:dynein axonemal heavy chain 6-like n=1 Tax=Protopterus annectens TaxID=7888 RepID=UPI001CFB1165|nr:dynein axonemal heavy chain 6-like [Protopterus annectens]